MNWATEPAARSVIETAVQERIAIAVAAERDLHAGLAAIAYVKAILAERKRCAEIATALCHDLGGIGQTAGATAAAEIARRIRSTS